jgi:hypothetical protein
VVSHWRLAGLFGCPHYLLTTESLFTWLWFESGSSTVLSFTITALSPRRLLFLVGLFLSKEHTRSDVTTRYCVLSLYGVATISLCINTVEGHPSKLGSCRVQMGNETKITFTDYIYGLYPFLPSVIRPSHNEEQTAVRKWEMKAATQDSRDRV